MLGKPVTDKQAAASFDLKSKTATWQAGRNLVLDELIDTYSQTGSGGAMKMRFDELKTRLEEPAKIEAAALYRLRTEIKNELKARNALNLGQQDATEVLKTADNQ